VHRGAREPDAPAAHFTATFAATEKIRKAWLAKWNELLEEMAAGVDACEATTVYHLNFDIFEP
jgi:hypothetical protein